MSAETFTGPLAQGVAQQQRRALIRLTNSIAVSGLEVVNRYGEHIQDLRDGDVLDVQDARYEWINIRALLTGDLHGSVKFYLNKAPYRIENEPPYIMNAGLRKWWSGSGSYTVEATPFSGRNGQGIPGESLAVTFTIADKDRGMSATRQSNADDKNNDQSLSAYPVSTHRFIHLAINEDIENAQVQLTIRNVHSQVLFKEERLINAQPLTLDLDGIGLSNGIYYLQVRTPSTIRIIRFIKE